eukprot:COSAG02_NODE_58838_length_276_cov_0.587571_1_plen_38_part_10
MTLETPPHKPRLLFFYGQVTKISGRASDHDVAWPGKSV